MADKDSFWCANKVHLNAGENLKQGRSLIGKGSTREDHAYAPILPLHGQKMTGVPPAVKKVKASVK